VVPIATLRNRRLRCTKPTLLLRACQGGDLRRINGVGILLSRLRPRHFWSDQDVSTSESPAGTSTTDMKFHDPEHKFERNYWGDCTNTFMEEQKHFVQARLMGIKINGCSLDAMGKRILDIGGGPVSMLLKTQNLAFGMVCDPITYPAWVYERYRAKGIICLIQSGEHVISFGWDEVWIYNVLQHCMDPKKIIDNARKAAPLIRIFEWIDFPPHQGHPQMLTESALNSWLGGTGVVKNLAEPGLHGKSYSGVFRT